METEKIVLDASVAIKWFSEEKNTDLALEIRELYTKGEIDIAVPDLFFYEITNAMRYNPDFNAEDVKMSQKSIAKLNILSFEASQEILEMAIETSFEFETTVYDSIYVALSRLLGVKLVTADREISQKLDNVMLLENFG